MADDVCEECGKVPETICDLFWLRDRATGFGLQAKFHFPSRLNPIGRLLMWHGNWRRGVLLIIFDC